MKALGWLIIIAALAVAVHRHQDAVRGWLDRLTTPSPARSEAAPLSVAAPATAPDARMSQARATLPPAYEWAKNRTGAALNPTPRPRAPVSNQPATERGYHYEWSPASQRYVPVRDGSSWRRSVGGG